MKSCSARLCVSLVFFLSAAGAALAAEKGREDLDAATQKKLEARTLGDLGEVIELCESALEKGLDEGGEAFAKQLLTSTLLQRGSMLTRPIFGQTPPSRQWQQLRVLALHDLEKAVEVDEQLGEAQLLVARLHALPGGDEKKAQKAIASAIEAFDEDPRKKADALTQRAKMQSEPEKRLADLNAAIETFPANDEALRLRGLHHLDANDYEKGLPDLLKVLERNPEDVVAHQAAAEAFASLKKYDEALEHLSKSIDLNDESGAGYILRARLYAEKGDNQKAEEDLSAALKLNPKNLAALLMRAEIRARLEKYEQAESDIDSVLALRPGLPQAILLRTGVYAAQEKFLPAIRDLQQLLKGDEDNVEIRMQIAAFYVADTRPSNAIEVYSEILEDDPGNWQALRARGDAYLSIAKQKEAIEDYEAALKLKDDSDGLLNNLAWVLATSPDENLRDGKRAIELATKACELTDYKADHILSTLASAYAETGDFDTAIKWSSKAVAMADEGIKEQLKKELESYEQKKPWRELQNVQEKPEPEKASDTDLNL